MIFTKIFYSPGNVHNGYTYTYHQFARGFSHQTQAQKIIEFSAVTWKILENFLEHKRA